MSDYERPPNIVLVVADDLGIGDIGAYGSELIRTPVFDQLATTGITCDNMYAAAAHDTPSRAGMFTGRFGARYNLPTSAAPDSSAGLPPDATTVATLLHEAGYATGLFGQWRLGSQPGQHPLDHGFGRFSGTLYGTDVSPLAWHENRMVVNDEIDSADAARRITDDAVDFVAGLRKRGIRGRDQGPPLFLVVSHLAPHAPFAAEARFFGKSRAGLYGDVVQQLDHYLGVLVRRLRPRLRREPTLVIVTSDNGPRYEGRNQRRRGRKPEVYDGGVRVPFIASWLTGGRKSTDAIPRSLLDLPPSLCSLAGVDTPNDLDGEDMAALLTGGNPPSRGPVYLFYAQALNAVRSGNWKYHESFGDSGIGNYFASLYWPQLFDVDADFRENYSVHNLHPDVTTDLGARLRAIADDVAAEAASRAEEETA